MGQKKPRLLCRGRGLGVHNSMNTLARASAANKYESKYKHETIGDARAHVHQ